MSIARFFDKTVVIRRFKDIAGTSRGAFQATATADGAIQEADRAARSSMGILDERAWYAWFPEDTKIQEGDYITDSEGNRYSVREVTKKDYGINQHLEVLLVEYNA